MREKKLELKETGLNQLVLSFTGIREFRLYSFYSELRQTETTDAVDQ